MVAVLQGFGPFRWFLSISSLVLMLCAALAPSLEAADTLTTRGILYSAAALVPIYFFLLLFDVLMNRVQMADRSGEERARYAGYLWIELAVVVLLSLSWTPFFSSLLSR